MLELIFLVIGVVLVGVGYMFHLRRQEEIKTQFVATSFLGCLILCFYAFGILSFCVSIISSIIRAWH